MNGVLGRLGDMTVAQFLREYWQRKPVLIRNPFGDWFCPLTRDELLALARREDADSRLILTGDDQTELYHGPFEDGELDDLPPVDWTVLVQEVDRLSPRVAGLLARFGFLKNWRLDDVMVSHAAPGGGVGPHTDQYDVFLIQGTGRRRWEIETQPRPDPVWRDDSEVAVLAEFEPDASWILEPGDVLYLPPMIPHNGVALEECLTLSVGCRAPGTADLLTGVLAYAAEEWSGADRYQDPGLTDDGDPGHFTEEARSILRDRIREALSDDSRLDRWLGRYVTEPARGHSGLPPKRSVSAVTLRRRLTAGAVLRPAVISQTAYIEDPGGAVTLYFSGQEYPVTSRYALQVARSVTGSMPLDLERAAVLLDDPETAELLVTLVNAGALVLRDT